MLSPSDLEVITHLIGEAERRRHRAGAPIPPWLRHVANRVALELHTITSEHGHDVETSGSHSELIGVNEAARRLGCSTRHVRRIARDLDGQRAGHSWAFRTADVDEYARSKAEGRGRVEGLTSMGA